MEFHFYRPGEREYVCVCEIIEQTEDRVVLRTSREPIAEICIEPVYSEDKIGVDEMRPSMVRVRFNGELVGAGYYRKLGDIIDVVAFYTSESK